MNGDWLRWEPMAGSWLAAATILSLVAIVRAVMRTLGRDLDHGRASKKKTLSLFVLCTVALVAWIVLSEVLTSALALSLWGSEIPELDAAALACLDEELGCPEPAILPSMVYGAGSLASMFWVAFLSERALPRPHPQHTAKLIAAVSTCSMMLAALGRTAG